MTDRNFNLRLSCTYEGTKNNIDNLTVEVLNNNKWEMLELNIRSPGFLLFISGLFSCQHLYMRTNSAERNLVLASATGDLQVVADKNWFIKNSTITFNAKIKSGSPTEDDINYITDRMKHCPVSANLPATIQLKSSVCFE